jgi:hypothetical protein
MFRALSVAVAQSVELWIVDPAVAGSNPVGHPSPSDRRAYLGRLPKSSRATLAP